MERQGGGIDAPQATGLVRVQALVQKLDQVSPGGTLEQKEAHAPKRGSQKVYYFIDGGQREFHSEEELLAALGKEG